MIPARINPTALALAEFLPVLLMLDLPLLAAAHAADRSLPARRYGVPSGWVNGYFGLVSQAQTKERRPSEAPALSNGSAPRYAGAPPSVNPLVESTRAQTAYARMFSPMEGPASYSKTQAVFPMGGLPVPAAVPFEGYESICVP